MDARLNDGVPPEMLPGGTLGNIPNCSVRDSRKYH